jgi:hypothetical protein
LARGSYSFIQTNAYSSDYDTLAETVHNRIFFGGEHTCRRHPATVAGAYRSGRREAKKIIQYCVSRHLPQEAHHSSNRAKRKSVVFENADLDLPDASPPGSKKRKSIDVELPDIMDIDMRLSPTTHALPSYKRTPPKTSEKPVAEQTHTTPGKPPIGGLRLNQLLSMAAKSTDVHKIVQKGVVTETHSDLGGKLTKVQLDSVKFKRSFLLGK